MSWSVSDEDFAVYENAPFHNAPLRARRLGSLAASSMGLAAMFVLACAALFLKAAPPVDDLPTATIPSPPPAPRAKAPAPVAPKAAFDLDVPELGKEKTVSFEPRQAGGRKESLTFGGFEAGRVYLRVDVLQPTGDKLGNSDFFLGMARHASDAGLSVIRISQPAPIAGRAGAVEAADIRLSQRLGDGQATERSCAAVRLIDPALSIEVAGIACGTPARPIDRRIAGCLLDRLYYLPGGKNEALQRTFAKSEAGSCFAAPVETANAASARTAGKKRRH